MLIGKIPLNHWLSKNTPPYTAVDASDFKQRLLAEFPETELTTLSTHQVGGIVAAYPGLPDEYIAMLTAVGHGALADCTYAIYSVPVSAEEIYGVERSTALSDVALIGDDFCGYCLGYRGGQLGEVSESGSWQPIEGKTLIEFLAERVLEDIT